MTTKDKLLEAAKELLGERHRKTLPTTREITAKAGVNVALVNYHFGGKENLLAEAGGRKRVVENIVEDLIDSGCSLTQDAASVIHSVLRKHNLIG